MLVGVEIELRCISIHHYK